MAVDITDGAYQNYLDLLTVQKKIASCDMIFELFVETPRPNFDVLR